MAANPSAVAQAAYAAGFRGAALVTAVAVAGAESGFGANLGPSPTNDYGDWQINSPSHPQYSTSKLLSDPTYNAQAAFAISSGGTNWAPWSTYNSGKYVSYLETAQAAVSSLGKAAAAAVGYVFPLGPGYTKTQDYSAAGHQGVDLSDPAGTPIYAAAAGKIKSVGGDPNGFGNDYPVETLPDGTTLTYGHASKSYVTPGMSVVAGQIIALVGSEGDSTGPHLHFQVNLPSGASTDPLAWLAAQGASADPSAAAGANATLVDFPGGSFDPLNWPGDLAGSAGDAISSGLSDLAGALFFIAIKVSFVVTGGALIVLGLADTAKQSGVSLPPIIPIPA